MRLFIAILLSATAAPALAVDWSGVPAQEVLLFQPGQSSWEWLVVPARHDGARRMREGRDCLYCHAGEERVIGEAIGSGTRLEPAPMAGMPPVVVMSVQTARGADALHVRISWPAVAAGTRAGTSEVATQATILFGSEALPPTAIAGCWVACHSDLRGMPDAGAGDDRTKYLPNSRVRMTATGGGDALRTADELAAERAAGRLLDYVQVELDDGRLVRTLDGWFLEARHQHESPAATATAVRANGRWTVEFTRPLAPGGGRLVLEAGKTYSFNIALHENHAEGRHHYVAFPLALAVTSDAARIVERAR